MILPDWPQFILFMGATLALNITPGADVLYIAHRSLSRNKIHGTIAALGVSSGLFIHVLLIAFGVGEIVRYSPFAFWALKIIGALYLAYLAWKSFRSDGFVFVSSPQNPRGGLCKTYMGGILTTLLNPKVILFFLTFLPQFVDVEKGQLVRQLLVLGGLFIISGTCVNLLYVFFFSIFKNFLLKSKKISIGFQKLTGALFAVLACKVLLAESR